MSWSVHRVGKPAAVAATLAKDFAGITCAEPEQTIKNGVAAIVATSLAVFPSAMAVEVKGSGSQYRPDSSKDEYQNSVSLSITPIYGFVEAAPAEPAVGVGG